MKGPATCAGGRPIPLSSIARPSPGTAAVSHASQRLGVILGAYTVYLDLWLCDLDGNVIANGRADRFRAVGQNVAHTKWFREAKTLRSGDDYVAGDVENQPLLGNAQVATYCASVRAGGQANGAPIGVLAIHFDWEAQARSIVQGVRVGDSDKARVLLVDSNLRIIAASDGQGILSERVRLSLNGQRSGLLPGSLRRAGRVPCDARLRDVSGARLVRHDRLRGVVPIGQADDGPARLPDKKTGKQPKTTPCKVAQGAGMMHAHAA
ncbi:hypothetical protein ACVWWK_005748 [Bradyrhizobium sp. LB9.1b]